MQIGTVRLGEARVEDSRAGYHSFETGGSFEVFWHYASTGDEGIESSGWYWWPCFPGCLPDGDPIGPFPSSIRAYYDALEVDIHK